jgi:hypothetical protein
MGRASSTHGEKRNPYGVLVGNTVIERSNRRWEDNIKINVREIGWVDMDLIILAQDRGQWRAAMNTGMNFRVA